VTKGLEAKDQLYSQTTQVHHALEREKKEIPDRELSLVLSALLAAGKDQEAIQLMVLLMSFHCGLVLSHSSYWLSFKFLNSLPLSNDKIISFVNRKPTNKPINKSTFFRGDSCLEYISCKSNYLLL
jgi:hypothetical protein